MHPPNYLNHGFLMQGLNNIPVFFDENMSVTLDSISPSAEKPALVVQDWLHLKIPMDILPAPKISLEDLKLAHDAQYIADVLEGRRPNGFNNTDPAVAQSCLYTVGAMLAAADRALQNRQVAVAPVAGFHHAYHADGHGFCTFNGLMVTAMALHRSGKIQRVGILDLDQHYGDGTDDIIEHFKLGWVSHYSAGRKHRDASDAAAFLLELPKIMATFVDCDLLLYQAGADPHVNDALGGWMSTSELRTRDRMVFTCAQDMQLPLAWNLAGGYQRDRRGGIEPVLEIHRNTMQECRRIFAL